MSEEAGTTLTKEQMAEYLALKAAQEQQAQGPPQVTLASAQTPRAAPKAALPMAPAPYPGGGEAHYEYGDQQVAGPYHPYQGAFQGFPTPVPFQGHPFGQDAYGRFQGPPGPGYYDPHSQLYTPPHFGGQSWEHGVPGHYTPVARTVSLGRGPRPQHRSSSVQQPSSASSHGGSQQGSHTPSSPPLTPQASLGQANRGGKSGRRNRSRDRKRASQGGSPGGQPPGKKSARSPPRGPRG